VQGEGSFKAPLTLSNEVSKGVVLKLGDFFCYVQDFDFQRDQRTTRKFVPTAEGTGGLVSHKIVLIAM